MIQQILIAGQRCPSCGLHVQKPMHSCHAIRDNYAVKEPHWREEKTEDVARLEP